MRKQPSHPHQTSFGIDLSTAEMPCVKDDRDGTNESATLTVTVPDHVSVYTVTLKRTDVMSLQKLTIIRSPGDAAALFSDRLKDVDREHLLVLMLDTKQHVIGINTVSIGSMDSSLVHPREVFKPAIIGNAASIILAHNHPSGDPMPSQEDRRATERIVQAGKILGMEMLDKSNQLRDEIGTYNSGSPCVRSAIQGRDIFHKLTYDTANTEQGIRAL